MLRGIYAAASGMIHNQYRQDVAANNIANSNTAGYKQDRIVTQPFPEVMLQNKARTIAGVPVTQKLGEMPLGVEGGELFTDFMQGASQETGNDLDLAINGRGFFTLGDFNETANSIKYTRDGSFRLDKDGRIVASNGDYLMARDVETGSVGPMYVGEGKVSVTGEGKMLIDGSERYQLVISDVNDYNNLHKEGQNMYGVDGDGVVEASSGQYQINQGYIEGSNVDLGSEMVNMITNLRSYQANQRVMQSIDETLGKTVNEVGALK